MTPRIVSSSAPSSRPASSSPDAAPVRVQPRRVSAAPDGSIYCQARGPGHRHRGEDVAEHVGGGEPAQLGVGGEEQPVLEHHRRDPLHVVGHHVVRPRLAASAMPARCSASAPWARAEGEVVVTAGRVGEIDDVVPQRRGDVDRRDRLGDGGDLGRADHGLQCLDREVARLRLEDRHLGGSVRVAHLDAHEEAVELCLGQRIRALELDRVLRRDHHERRRADR